MCFQMYMFIFVFKFFFRITGVSLEWVWPNSLQTCSQLICLHFSVFFKECVWSEFGDSPNFLQTLSKLSPNLLQTQLSLKNQHKNNKYVFFLWSKVEMFKGFPASLEWVWRFSKLSPKSLLLSFFQNEKRAALRSGLGPTFFGKNQTKCKLR